MLDFFDRMLRQLLGAQVPQLSSARIGFAPPDKDWRNFVSSADSNALNVYLVELRENRALRANQRFLEQRNGDFQEIPVPLRMDCIYLISAWSPVRVGPLLEPTIDEHVLLYETARVLSASIPFEAAGIYAPNQLPAGFPDALLDPPPPAVVVPPDGFAKLSDFWMRMDWVWKPVVELMVTIPVVAVSRPTGPPVTTIFEHFLQAGQSTAAATLEEVVTIGGVVRAGGTPVGGAWVRLVERDTMVATNSSGQFTFVGLLRGTYTLESGAIGFPARSRTIQVPSDSGEYDLSLG